MNKDALRQLQKSMRQSRLNEMNPMGTSKVMQIKESYVKKDSLQALEEAVIASLAKIRAEIDRIDQDSRIALKEAKNALSGDIKKTENALSERLKKEIEAVSQELDYTGNRVDEIGTKLPKILAMPVQRQLSIPVAIDEGGTGKTNNNTVDIGNQASDGSWRFSISGTDLIAERRESGVWVTKGSFTA